MLNRLVIGGAPLDTVQLAGYLSQKHEVYLVVGEKNKDEYDASFLLKAFPDLQVIHINEVHRSVNLLRDVNAFFHIRRVLKKIGPDVVHTNGAKPGLLGRLAAISLNTKVIIHTYHGHVFHSYFNKFFSSLIVRVEKALAKRSTKIIAISESQRNELANTYKICPASKISVINLGIDVAKFMDDSGLHRKSFRKEYLLNEDEIAIGIVGRIVPVKDHFLFLKIVEKLLQNTSKKIRFFIIGDGKERIQLADALNSKHIDHVFFPEEKRIANVTFTSWILEIENAMNGLDIVVLTSLNEGVPIALLEAGAAARPIISTNVGSVNEIITDNKNGFVISSRSPEEFANKLQLLINDSDLREKMGEEGRSVINNRYRKEVELANVDQLYYELLNNTI